MQKCTEQNQLQSVGNQAQNDRTAAIPCICLFTVCVELNSKRGDERAKVCHPDEALCPCGFVNNLIHNGHRLAAEMQLGCHTDSGDSGILFVHLNSCLHNLFSLVHQIAGSFVEQHVTQNEMTH